jgi:pilus assembly protein CpaC
VPEKGPRPAKGAESVSALVDNLSSKDAVFEVTLGQGRILSLKENIAEGKNAPVIATGDPTVLDFIVVNPRQIRVVGLRLGVTDLSITTATGKTYSFEVRVVMDLDILRARLKCLFPDAALRVTQIRDQLAVEGEARDTAQAARILETIRAYLISIQVGEARQISGTSGGGRFMPSASPEGAGRAPLVGVSPELVPLGSVQSVIAPIPVINLLRVPGSHQVLLKVRVAEMNRTALRQIGADILTGDPGQGAVVGTQIGGATVAATAGVSTRVLSALTSTTTGTGTTVFGIFERGDFAFFLSALRRNQILKILAEPNLVALNGQQASFLAGGEFPVPVPQFGGAGGAAATVTVQFKQFGVQLGFLPFILDGDVIRLTVDPEVSEIDFSIATTLVPGGSPVPGLSTRKTHTTVELRQGQTLMVSGLMQLTLNGNTARIPGLGDLPIIGPFFSNTTSNRVEKELVVLVTPYLVEGMNPGEVPPTPGDEVKEPNDLEFYFLNRIESRTGRDFRSTTKWDDPLHIRNLLHLESKEVCGPHGFED